MTRKDLPVEFKRRILDRYHRKIWTSYCQRIADFLLEHNLNPDDAEIIIGGSYEFDYKARDTPIAYLGCKGKHAWKKLIFIAKSKPAWYSRGHMRYDVVEELMKEKEIKGYAEQDKFKQETLSDPALKKEVSKRVRAKIQTLKKGGIAL